MLKKPRCWRGFFLRKICDFNFVGYGMRAHIAFQFYLPAFLSTTWAMPHPDRVNVITLTTITVMYSGRILFLVKDVKESNNWSKK